MAFKTVNQVLETYKTALKSIYPIEEIRNFVLILFEFKMGFSKIDFLMKGSDLLDDAMIYFCKEALEKLKNHIPIQQIVGETEFYDLKFKVTPDVLIPRPETEELVQWILDANQMPAPKILDIGTGSGCIPITLKKNIPNAKVTSWDVSDKALLVARENARLNDVDINFVQNNALNPSLIPDDRYNIIVSNPPYVRELEKEFMQDNVLSNEPHLALFVPNEDPLLFYRKISELAVRILEPEGELYFEINEAFGEATCELMKELGFKQVELRKDLFGKDRMVKGVI